MGRIGKTLTLLLAVLFISSLVMAQPIFVKAQSKTIIVPDDFATIQSAINHATNGGTVYVRSGIYTENELSITKSISLIGENVETTKIKLNSEKHDEPLYPEFPDIYRAIWYDRAMAVYADNFVLSGLTISTTGGDINITGNNNKIESNFISAPLTVLGFNNKIVNNTLSSRPINIAGNHCNFTLNKVSNGDVNFAGQYNTVSFNTFGGSFSAVSDESYFYSNFCVDAQYGAFKVNGNNNVLCKNVLDHFGDGLILIGYGNKAMLNNVTYCRIGISPSADSIMYANYIANNEWTINSRNAIINPYGNLSFLVHNNFVDNRYYQMWTMVMSNITDYLDNGIEGNYWNTYQGEDNNNDGVGDSPFYLDSTHLDRYPLINPVNLSAVEEVIPDWLIMPTIEIINPESVTYSIRNVSVDFVLNKPVSWIGYSLDENNNETISGNLTLTDLSLGTHNITIYAIDEYGNEGSSETVSFTIEENKSLSNLLVTAVIVSVVSISLACIVLLRKHKKTANST
jgi:nitrous oxidase accessory protein NosD